MIDQWPCQHACEVATVVYGEGGGGACIVCGRRWEVVDLGGEGRLKVYGTSCTVGHGGVYFPAPQGRGRGPACAHSCPLRMPHWRRAG